MGADAVPAREGTRESGLLEWEELYERQRRQQKQLAVGKAHFEEVRVIEGAGDAAYQRRMEGSEERAEAAVEAGRWREGGDLYRYGVSATERRVKWLLYWPSVDSVCRAEACGSVPATGSNRPLNHVASSS